MSVDRYMEEKKPKLLRHTFSSTVALALLVMSVYGHGGTKDSPKTAEEWLGAMISTMSSSSYKGKYVYFDGTQLRPVSLKYANIGGVSHELIMHLEGVESEILRIGNEVTCLHDGKIVDRFTQPSALSTSALRGFASSNMLKHYKASLGKSTRVAGKKAMHISLMPKDKYRYGYHVWVDRGTYLLLKSVLSTGEQEDMEVFEFIDISLTDDLTALDFKISGVDDLNSDPIPENSKGQNSPNQVNWEPTWLPDGFMHHKILSQARVQQPANSLDMRSYSDGISSFSLFISMAEELALDAKDEMAMKRGATFIYSKLVNNKQYRVTFVGELPLAAARRIVGSVELPATQH